MASPVWKGLLRYGFFQFPIKIFAGARRADSFPLNQVHRPDGARVKQILFCSAEDKAIPREEIAKGYEYEKGKYVLIDEAELDPSSVPSDLFALTSFVEQPDPIYFDESFYVHPDGDEADYTSLLVAMRQEQLCGVGEILLHKRERYMLVRPGTRGVIAHTLFTQFERRSLEEFRAEGTLKPASRKEVLRLTAQFQPELLDPYYVRIGSLVVKKLAALAPQKAKSRPTKQNSRSKAS